MLLVHTFIAPSPIHGIGLFAAEFIPAGSRTWELSPSMDLIVPKAEVSKLSPPARERFLHYAYLNSKDAYVLCFDDARFYNHGLPPNTKFVDGDIPYEVSTRDIEEGEELTINYSELDCDSRKSPYGFFLTHASAEAISTPRHQIAAMILGTDFSRASSTRRRQNGFHK